MPHKKRIVTVEVDSCINCPFGKMNAFDRDTYPEKYELWCRKLCRVIKPSRHEVGADYYHIIPDDCTLDTLEDFIKNH